MKKTKKIKKTIARFCRFFAREEEKNENILCGVYRNERALSL